MGLTYGYGPPASKKQAVRVIQEALQAGVTMFDTAEMYGPHTNEELLGEALGGSRDKVCVATKFGVTVQADGSEAFDGSADNVHRSVEGSLRRLGTDYIDLFYQHRIDRDTPIEETVGALAEEVAAGRIRSIGLSEASSATIRRAHAVHPLAAVQTEMSLFSRDAETDVFPTVQELGIGFVAYSPLGRGVLTGTIRSRDDLDTEDRRLGLPRMQEANFESNLALVERLEEIAKRKGVSSSQVALAWVLSKSGTFVIPGTTNPSRVSENAAAAELSLDESELAALEQSFAPGAAAGARLPEGMLKDVDG